MGNVNAEPKVTWIEPAHSTEEGLEAERERLKAQAEGYRTRPDYNHFIVTRPGSEKYERRMNRMMNNMKRLDPEADAERIRLMREEVAVLASKVFKITGKGVTGDADETYNRVILSTMKNFKLGKKPYSFYVRSVYSENRKDPIPMSQQPDEDAPGLDEVFREAADTDSPGSYDWLWDTGKAAARSAAGRDAELESEYTLSERAVYESMDMFGGLMAQERAIMAVYGASDIDSLSREQIASAEDASLAADFLAVLTLVNNFLEHREDKVRYTPKQKLYRKMLFTEELTYSVRKLANYEECAPFERHERDAFDTAELPFQDVYTEEVYRTIRALWEGDLKREVDGIAIRRIRRPGDDDYDERVSWGIPNALICRYLEHKMGESVTDQAVSNQRQNYLEMKQKFGLEANED